MRAGRGLAIASMLAGFGVSVLTSFELVTLFRDQLRYQCTFLTMGESDSGSFACADGIGYLLVGGSIHGVSVLVMLAVAIVVYGPATPKAKSRSVRVTGLAVVPPAFFIAATVYTVIQRPAAEREANYWLEPMLPASIVLGMAIALIVVAPAFANPRLRGVSIGGAALLLGWAAVVQPGALPSVAMSLGMLLAAVFLWRGELVQQRP